MLRQIQLLTPDELARVREILPTLDFSDIQNMHPGQNNTEAVRDQTAREIAQIVADAFQRTEECRLVVRERIEHWIISKTEPGQEFKVHHDNPRLGHYSLSVYLSETGEYEGGSLCLMPENEEIKYRPEAGSGVIYDTGIPHCVEPVTKGTRYVCILWIISACQDANLRESIGELVALHKHLSPPPSWDNFEDAKRDPGFVVGHVINRLLHRFAPGYN